MRITNFKNKILALTLILIVLFTLVIVITISNSFNSILGDIIFQNERSNTAQKAELIANWFEKEKSDLEIYANTKIIQKGSPKEKLNYLNSELEKRNNNYFFFFIADEKGNYSTTSKMNAGNISERDYFPKVLEGKTVISNPLISKSTEKPIIVIASPIQDDDNFSLLAATIKINKLSQYINSYTNNEKGIYSFLINDQGKIIAHPESENIDTQFFYDSKSFFKKNYDFIDEIKNKNQGNLIFKENDNKKHAFYQEVSGTNGWKIVSIVPQNYLKRSINKINKIIIFISIIAILSAIVLTMFLADNIAQPIIQLKNTFQKGAAGNLNVRSKIDSDDEIGDAARSFNKMMDVIKDLSFNDALTGLPNINFFKKELTKKIKNDKENKYYICALGIDDFKSINDSFGHNIGNEILKAISQRLSKNLKENYLISRVGDEFYFYLKSEQEITVIEKRLEKLLRNINNNYFINNKVIYLRSSMGVTIFPDDNKNINKLVKNAALAMHTVKKNNSDKIIFYSVDMDENIFYKKRLENQLITALKNKEFKLHFQSQISSQDEKIVGFEALIRWKHPKEGLIPPNIFIPLAEKNGSIKEIGTWVLRKSVKEIKKLNDRFNKNYFISVNISPDQFVADDFIEVVKSTLAETGLKASNLELEITERTTIENISYTIRALEQLQKLGVRIAIDDFGTGYSSLNYIKEFAISTLKIDKSFIDGFIKNKNNKAIVNTIISLAHNLNLTVVAEGVEKKEQKTHLKKSNCDVLQGFYFSQPAPIESIISDLEKND